MIKSDKKNIKQVKIGPDGDADVCHMSRVSEEKGDKDGYSGGDRDISRDGDRDSDVIPSSSHR